MKAQGLRGIIAAVPTPVTPQGEPDAERFLHHARWALDNGCDALNVLGTTGEANSLSAGQRRTVMAVAASAFDGGRLMVGTGAADIATAIELTRHAHELGYSGALVLPPFYYKAVTDEGLFRWFAALFAGTEDTPIPVYLYHFPQLTGLPFSLELVARLKRSFPERLAGIKDSSGDFAGSRAFATIADFDVFPGSESGLTDGDASMFAGCISATVSVTAPLVARFWRDRDNAAARDAVNAARSAIAALPMVPAVKHMVARLHGDLEYERVLPPHVPLNPAGKAQLAGLRLPQKL